jgi:hypothetical protein
MSREGDEFNDMFHQVEAALDAMNLGQGDTRDALMSGVREALTSLVDVDLSSVQVDAGHEGPGVVVLDGGKGDDTDEVPKDASGRPDFQVFDGDDAMTDEVPKIRPDVQVRVIRSGTHPEALDPMQVGQIVLPAQEAEGPWQTVYRGASEAAYRLVCDFGALEISLEGDLVEQLVPGRSIDLSGQLIRVRPRGAKAAQGRYLRQHR